MVTTPASSTTSVAMSATTTSAVRTSFMAAGIAPRPRPGQRHFARERPAPVARLADDIAAQLALPLDTEAPMPAGFVAVG